MIGIPEKVAKSTKRMAWVGTSNDLSRLLKTIETHVEELRDDFVEHELKWIRRDAEAAQARLDRAERNLADAQLDDGRSNRYLTSQVQAAKDLVASIGRNLDTATAEARGAPPIDLVVYMKDRERREVSGTAEELISYLAGRDFSRLEFDAPSFTRLNHRATLRADIDDGVRLDVTSDDSKWATALFADASEQLRKRSPKWMFVRVWGLLFAVFWLLGFFLCWTMLDIIAKWTTPTGRYDDGLLTWMWILVFMVALGAGSGGAALVRHVIPAFDLSFEGKPNAGARMLRLVGGSIGALILGVVGNIISAGITLPGG